MSQFVLHHGDCREVMATLDAESVDAVVCDPPYGLSFMGKGWDHGVPGVEFWTEALRVAKPGAHLLAFGGTRTYHRLACAIEDAGWEIRDCVMWVYSQGFPKSLDVSKAIDKAGGGDGMPENDRKAFAAELRDKRESSGITRQTLASWFPQYSEVTKNWERQDAGFRVPSEKDYQVLVDRLGISESWRLRVRAEDKRRLVAEDLQDRRGDESVIGLGHSGKEWASTTDAARQWQGWGTALKPAWEPIIVARKPLCGNVAENVLRHGTGAINVDGCRVPAEGGSPAASRRETSVRTGTVSTKPGSYDRPLQDRTSAERYTEPRPGEQLGRWPANVIHDGSDEVVGLFPQCKSGEPGVRRKAHETVSMSGRLEMTGEQETGYGDSGSAARFFYCPKASKADRDEGCEGPRRNHHPTVKPTALMRYLCRLVTPPGGVVLDPFTGSGSTGKAAVLEGFDFVGIEREAEYVEIARARIDAVVKKVEAASPSAKSDAAPADAATQLPLFSRDDSK